MSTLTVAALQLALSDDTAANCAAVAELARQAAADGADVILPPELFAGHYFCQTQDESAFARAHAVADAPEVSAMQQVAAELKVSIPTSFFEADGPHAYNSVAMIDADGQVAGVYRKSHIPDGPGYQEKFYFRPGNTGFTTWPTPAATLGIGICWDQWYPECARALVLNGAEVLLFPTAIGSEPEAPDLDTSRLWRRAMIGHAVSNGVPLVAANRIGTEGDLTFYGQSFVADVCGDVIAEAGPDEEAVVLATIDLDHARRHRAAFGFFRDRRPDLYRRLVEDR
jgi:N-carbamoylputrescine amidase